MSLNSGSFHRVVKQSLNLNSHRNDIVFPGRSTTGTYDDIFSYFSSLANTHPSLFPGLEFTSNVSDIPLMEELDVYNYLKATKSNSSIAPDDIPSFIWSEFAIELVAPITSLINLSLISSRCPDLWKTSYLVPLAKVSHPKDSSQLRPIAIASLVGKICERHILKHVLPIIIPSLDIYQFGGIPRRSTSHYLTLYIERALKELERKSISVCSIVSDFSKAYDNLDHGIFLSKLSKILPLTNLFIWIKSFLVDRKIIVKLSGCPERRSFLSSNGVPQGSVLGGLFFAILINDVLVDEKYHLKFVDDLTVSCVLSGNNLNEPQCLVDKLHSQTKSLNMPLNSNKCCIIIHSFKKIKPKPDVYIDGVLLRDVSCVKILGIWLQSDLKWNTNTANMIKKANQKMFFLYKLKRLGLNQKFLLMVYVMYIRPCLEYCAPVWSGSLSLAQGQSLEMVQKRAFRVILGNGYVSYDDSLLCLGLKSLHDRRNWLTYQFSTSFFNSFPEFLPINQGQISGRNTRGCHKYVVPWSKTNRYKNSPVNNMINIMNSLSFK